MYSLKEESPKVYRWGVSILGAWGCGVFRNQPSMVADAFGVWLESGEFRNCFDRVVFGIYDSSKEQATLQAFKSRFPAH